MILPMNAQPRTSLRELFLGALEPSSVAIWQGLASLGLELERIWATATEAWPDVAVSSEEFCSQLAKWAPPDASLSALAALHACDLYLALACASGQASALRAFEVHCADAWAQALSKVAVSAVVANETQQALRTRLFVGQKPGEEHIRRYSGRGDLRAWYRTTAIRALIDATRAQERHRGVDDSDLDAHVAMVDLELDYLKRNYRAEFKASFHAALGTLTAEERNLLRYQLLEHLTLEQMGRIYGVHLTSIARRLQKLRTQLLHETRDGLRGRLGVDEGELDSIMRLIGSRLDVSLSSVLSENASET